MARKHRVWICRIQHEILSCQWGKGETEIGFIQPFKLIYENENLRQNEVAIQSSHIVKL